jgi:hypothetical protein
VVVLVGTLKERLQADADAEEGLAGADVGDDGGRVPGVVKLGQAVAEAADTRQDQDLGSLVSCRWRWGRTSALATSPGDLIHFTDQPSVSMALTRDRTLPAT